MIEPRILSQAIASGWERIALALANEREQFEYELLPLLRQLDAEGQDSTAAVPQVLSLFAKVPPAEAVLLEEIRKAAPPHAKGTLEAVRLAEKIRYTLTPVFFATDRDRSTPAEGRPVYGPGRGELAYGMASVSIPDDHRMGQLERPRWWKLEFRADPNKHVVIRSVQEMPSEMFVSRARETLARGPKREVLVFVHGYNVGFDDAIARTAQIAYDLHFEGLAASYSWPSVGAAPDYLVDETNVLWSRPRFAEFLRVIREQLGADTVHIMAHSMGSRLLAETVKDLPIPTGAAARLRQIVFAAPDIDASTFKDLASKFSDRAERFTLYASSEDKALKASKAIHGYPRAGESGLDLVVVPRVDTIDATGMDTSLLGHSYYADNRSILSDLFYLIREGKSPPSRFGLLEKTRYGVPYWMFRL